MARILYSLLLYVLTPALWLRLFWRARKQPAYAQHLAERYGFYQQSVPDKLIWLHAVSVGETRAAQPLIEALQARWPQYRILLTCMTPTGRETGQHCYGARVIQAYLPYDYPGAMRRFLRYFAPEFGLLMETELWPHLLHTARTEAIPVFLVNARLSARSARGYGKFAALSRPSFAALSAVLAQTDEDKQRFIALGAKNVHVFGNLKFDVTLSPEMLSLGHTWRQALRQRLVWLAASTREGEEALVIDAWRQLNTQQVLLLLVPRHPQRFAELAQSLQQQGIAFVRRTDALPEAAHAVWLGDSMGEMAAYYTLADLAFVGGSLLPLGGQNLIEAAAAGCPVLIGPHTFNFLQVTEDAIRAGAACRVADPQALAVCVDRLLADATERSAMAAAAKQFAQAHQGATARTLEFIAQRRDQAGH